MWEAQLCQHSAPVSSLHTCCRRPLFGHRQASWGHNALWTLVCSFSQADRPFAHRASSTLIRADKLGLASESCSIDTIHLKILNDHILQMDFVYSFHGLQ